MTTGILEPSISNDEIRKQFFQLYWQSRVLQDTRWKGVNVLKCPLDLWLYQEIIYDLKPDVIIETGTYRGGSALFMADILDSIGNGRIYSVDIEDNSPPKHPRINYLLGSSTNKNVFDAISPRIKSTEKVMVVLDGDHEDDHVLREMLIYGPLVTPGQYMIVEDTVLFAKDGDGGPLQAVKDYLCSHDDFVADESMHKFHISFMPYGFLRRK